MQLTPSFLALLENFRLVFTAPAFRLFVLLLTGWALSCRHRFITECLFTAGQVRSQPLAAGGAADGVDGVGVV